MQHFRPLLKKNGLTDQQWRILRVLDDFGPQDASIIAQRTCILAPSLSGILQRMEKADLVTRQRNRKDNRCLIVELSKNGNKLMRKMTALVTARYQHIEDTIGEERLHEIELMLTELEQLTPPNT